MEDLSSVNLDQPEVGVFVLLAVTHVGQLGCGKRFGQGSLEVAVEALLR